jgi:hypothetical protein
MQCIRQFKKGDEVVKEFKKKTYKTFEDAFRVASKMNKNERQIRKMVAYKCRECLRFHVGGSKHGTILQH